MNERVEAGVSPADLGDYCRRVEEHLTRVNEGQLIRVVGPAFELVRGWALEGVPLSIVVHGIDLKSARHRAGTSKRPLRLEFCEADVREVYARWRRSVGLNAGSSDPQADSENDATGKRPSLSRQLDRALDKLSRASGRLDLPEAFRDTVSQAIADLSQIRESARTARGEARGELMNRLIPIEAALADAGRAAVGGDACVEMQREAEHDLAAYRTRLSPELWKRSVDRSVDQLVRDHLGLPTLNLEG